MNHKKLYTMCLGFFLLLFTSPATQAENIIALSDIDTAIRKICEEANKKGAFDLIEHVKPCIQIGLEAVLSNESHMTQKEALILLKKTINESEKLLTLVSRSLLGMIDMHHDLQLQEEELQRLFGWSSSEVYKHTAKIMHTVLKEKVDQLWFISQLIAFNLESTNGPLSSFNQIFSEISDETKDIIKYNHIDHAPTIKSTVFFIGYRYVLLFDEIRNQILDMI